MSNDAQWYIERKEEDYYEIFFEMCRKFGISWGRATEKEKMFIEEVTRVTYEHRGYLKFSVGSKNFSRKSDNVKLQRFVWGLSFKSKCASQSRPSAVHSLTLMCRRCDGYGRA